MIRKIQIMMCVCLSVVMCTTTVAIHRTVLTHAKPHSEKPRIVILGAGYGTLTLLRKLQEKISSKDAEITLINPNNYHYKTARLHELAAGSTSESSLTVPLSEVISMEKLTFIQDKVKKIDPSKKKLFLENKKDPVPYDYVVIGLGSSPETFEIPGVNEHAYFIGDITNAIKLQKHVNEMFQGYKKDSDDDLMIVVGGAGLAGIEYLGELIHRVPALCENYNIPKGKVKIINVVPSSTILRGFDHELSSYAKRELERKGVRFILNTKIVSCSEDGATLSNGQKLQTKTIVWTAGVRGNRVLEESGFDTQKGRIPVDHHLKATGAENIYVIGDSALLLDEHKTSYPPTAEVAIAEGQYLGEHLPRVLAGVESGSKPFHFKPQGIIASLGDGNGFGEIHSKKYKGLLAFVMKKKTELIWTYQTGGIFLVIKDLLPSLLLILLLLFLLFAAGLWIRKMIKTRNKKR